MKCNHCGHRVKPGKFCMHCGSLAPEAAPAIERNRSAVSPSVPAPEPSPPMGRKVSPLLIILPVFVLILSFVVTLGVMTDCGQSLTTSDFSPVSSAASQTDNTASNTEWADYRTAVLGKDELLLVLNGGDLYYLDGITPHLLSSSAWEMDLFASCEQIADGTFFVVENQRESDSIYEDLREEGGKYRVGSLVTIAPDGERTRIDENVYEVVFSLYDDVCYYQVIEQTRQKICVVKDGVSYDVTGWVEGNVDYISGSPDGERAYFIRYDDAGEAACLGQNGSHAVIKDDDTNLYWAACDDEDPAYVFASDADVYRLSAVKDGEIVCVLPDAVDFAYHYKKGYLAMQNAAGELLLYRDCDTSEVIAADMTADDKLGFVNTHGFGSDWLIYSVGGEVFVLDTAKQTTASVLIGTVPDWRYAYDPETEYIYITGDEEAIYTYKLGENQSERIPLRGQAADYDFIEGAPGAFCYFTGDAESYDYTEDLTDLHYFNGTIDVALMRDASWYVGAVTSAFDGESVLWLADGNLYMADTMGRDQMTVLSDAWWVTEVNDNFYGITYDGEVYLIHPDGGTTLLMDGVEDLLKYKPEW